MMEQPIVRGKIVPFEEVSGPQWQEYNLADGNMLRLKVELLKVLATGQKNPNTGEPIYSFELHTVATVFTEEPGYCRLKR